MLPLRAQRGLRGNYWLVQENGAKHYGMGCVVFFLTYFALVYPYLICYMLFLFVPLTGHHRCAAPLRHDIVDPLQGSLFSVFLNEFIKTLVKKTAWMSRSLLA